MRVANQMAVAHAWAKNEGGDYNCGAAMYSVGEVIYSYGSHHPLARFVAAETVVINSTPSSVTTAKHHRYISAALPPYVRRYYAPGACLASVIEYAVGEIVQLSEKIPRARKNAEYYRLRIEKIRHNIAAFRKQFPKQVVTASQAAILEPETTPEQVAALTAQVAAEIKAAETAARVEAAKKQARDIARQVREWKAGRYKGHIAGEYAYLRADGELVYTSKYASMKVDQARGLWILIKAGRDIPDRMWDGYRVAYNHRKLQIGCHIITLAEIRRFARLMGW